MSCTRQANCFLPAALKLRGVLLAMALALHHYPAQFGGFRAPHPDRRFGHCCLRPLKDTREGFRAGRLRCQAFSQRARQGFSISEVSPSERRLLACNPCDCRVARKGV
jgi:hypothetical protein